MDTLADVASPRPAWTTRLSADRKLLPAWMIRVWFFGYTEVK
jgi:hypothetical protein